MKTSDFDYDLPQHYIAQTPINPRHDSRLLVLNRHDQMLSHHRFFEIAQFLNPGDLLVINQTRVIPARIFAVKHPSGGKVEVLLLRKEDLTTWVALIGGKHVRAGQLIAVVNGPMGEVLSAMDGAQRLIRFSEPIEPYFDRVGHVPLPPYIHEKLSDPERYQTVYAQTPGSAAAPTAGLHFTPQLLAKLEGSGVNVARLTLHVGLDTFLPVNEENPHTHAIHSEWCELTADCAKLINQTAAAGGRIIAVGTTSVRTLETAAQAAPEGQRVAACCGATRLFILPGYTFKAVDAIITNFHLPKSTLLMLVSAFAGREQILHAYEVAKQENYRFFSFGDAMFIC